MHREFDPADAPFTRRTPATLYLLTLLVGGLVVADVWPPLAAWLAGLGLDLPTFTTREIYGYRFALIAAVIGGARSLYAALDRLTDGKLGADAAVAVACIAAILIGEPLVAAEVVAIGLVGECLELTFGRTQSALRGLAEIFPLRTWVLRDGVEVRAFTADLVPGDVVVVKPGGKIPVDGVVTAGASTVDTAALTGESLPRDVVPGDAVLAGFVNQFGALTITAEKVAKQTVAGRVMDLTAAALKEKAPLERYADALARRFLPVVFGLALLAFAANFGVQLFGTPRPTTGAAARVALYPALAVLVVACPCPLVLATPAAVIAALGRLAGTGVLIKGGAALERLAGVTAVAFDKTGTLTEGKLEVGDIHPFGGATADDVLRVAAGAEAPSEHPLARAVVAAAAARNLAKEDAAAFAAHPGAGVTATVGGAAVVVGTARFLESQNIAVPPAALAALDALAAGGQSGLLVARRLGVVLGAVGAKDTLRPEAAGVLAELAELGLSPILLLTGDRAAAAHAVAGQLPLTAVHADLLPAQKAELLASGGRKPAVDEPAFAQRFLYVGDGLNDAPALARAAVGVAVGGGADLAAEAGDIVLLGDPLRPLPLLVRLSREMVKIVRQNILWFGFGVNLVGVALTGFLWPLFAASPDWYEKAPLAGVLYHQIGSLAVLLNSMRLLGFERPSPLRARFAKFARAADRLSAAASPDELLHHAGHAWKPILRGGLALAAVAWLASGLTQIDATEVGVVRRFGAVVADLEPGLHVRFPYPIEEVATVSPAAVRTVEIGFRSLTDDAAGRLRLAKVEQEKLRRPGIVGVTDRDLTWASGHADGVQRITDESLMPTGDGNLVEVLATVRYTVRDPRAFLFASADPDAVVRAAAEGVLREQAAAAPFAALLTADRGAFERRAAARLTERLNPAALGISFAGLTLHDLHPPQEVVASYHRVAEAIQARDRLVNEAEADATRARRRAEEDALRLTRSAEADAARKLADAAAARDTFLAWHVARNELSPAEKAAEAVELESRVKAGQDRATAAADLAVARAKTLAARRALTDFRLTLAATVAVLAGRDKVFVDADNLPGKRHLLLADPDANKLPPWLLRPPAEKEP